RFMIRISLSELRHQRIAASEHLVHALNLSLGRHQDLSVDLASDGSCFDGDQTGLHIVQASVQLRVYGLASSQRFHPPAAQVFAKGIEWLLKRTEHPRADPFQSFGNLRKPIPENDQTGTLLPVLLLQLRNTVATKKCYGQAADQPEECQEMEGEQPLELDRRG